MRKNILYIGLAAILSLAQTACQDNKSEFLEDFSTILYFKNSGEVPLTLYKTGENTNYTIVVDKAGSSLTAVTSVGVALMDEASLVKYNAAHGTTYKMMPQNCYSFQDTQLEFGSADSYKTLDVSLITDEIDKIATPEEVYVIPFEMRDSADSINIEKKMLFIKPAVIIPRVYFGKTGYQMNTISDEGAEQVALELPLALPLENKWEFDCSVVIDAALLDAYNKKNGVDYSLLPPNAYTMNEGGLVGFTSGSATSNLHINVQHTALSYGNYVLPLKLNACTHPTFLIDESKNTCLFGVSYVPDASQLTKVALTESMISIFPDPTNEGSIAGMLDGDPSTYYHSNWSGVAPLPHHFDVKLPKESTAFMFEYQTRHDVNNGTPQQISIYGSTDGISFNKITTLTEDLPGGKSEWYKSPVIVGKSFKYFRFSVEQSPNGNSFALAEFRMSVN